MINLKRVLLNILFMLFIGVSTKNHHYEKFFEVNGGPKYMYYYTKFNVGNPPVEQSAIIDTGSDTLAFPCDHCQSGDCGDHADDRFNTRHSNTFNYEVHCANHIEYHKKRVCQFIKQYAEGSTLLGFLAEDYLKFKNAKAVNDNKLNKLNSQLTRDIKLKAEFGCTTKETGLFKDQFADGILGLDRNSSLIRSMEKKNSVLEPKVMSFGLCFHANGGIMSIDLRHKFKADDKIVMLNKRISDYPEIVEVPYSIDNNYYQIQVTRYAIWEGEKEHTNLPHLKPLKVMIDSGTTFTHLPDKHLQQILKTISFYCREKKNRCGRIENPVFSPNSCIEFSQPDDYFETEKELLDSFPDIKLHFGDRTKPYTLRPKNYFYKEHTTNKKDIENGIIRLCLALKGREIDRMILGAFGMIDYNFYFDRKAKNIKIFKEDCYLKTTQILRRKERILSEVTSYSAENSDRRIGYGWYILGFGSVGVLAMLVAKVLRTKTNVFN